jgi:hypothetical protein
MIDPNAKRMRAALERIAEDRWCSGDDLRDLAREALGLPDDTDDDTRAIHTGPAPDTASIAAVFKHAYECSEHAYECSECSVLSHRSPFAIRR